MKQAGDRASVRQIAASRRTRSEGIASLPFAGARELLDPTDDQVALDAAQSIDEQRAVEVIHLVLKGAGEKTGAFALMLVAFSIQPFDDGAFGSNHSGVEAGHAEASFFFELHA